jgi:hypothetical protein
MFPLASDAEPQPAVQLGLPKVGAALAGGAGRGAVPRGGMSSKSTVLVVEDEQLLLDIVALELEEAGFAVLQAETGEDAIHLLQGSERIDLLLTDIRLLLLTLIGPGCIARAAPRVSSRSTLKAAA